MCIYMYIYIYKCMYVYMYICIFKFQKLGFRGNKLDTAHTLLESIATSAKLVDCYGLGRVVHVHTCLHDT